MALKRKRIFCGETGMEQHGKEGDYTPSARIKQYIESGLALVAALQIRPGPDCLPATFRLGAAPCFPKNNESLMPTRADLFRRPLSLLPASLLLVALLGAPAVHADEYTDVNRLISARQFPQALASADRYLAAKPRDPQMRFLKGVIQSETAQTAEAMETFAQLNRDYPELPEPYNNLAVLYAGQGQFDKARDSLEMAVKLNPRYATAHENLGDIHARLASQSYSRALQLNAANAALPPKLALVNQLLTPAAKAAAPAKAP